MQDFTYTLPEFALFGPSEKHSVIKGGFCISVFAIAKKDSNVLLVKPKEHPKWPEEWAPNWRLYDQELLANEFKHWRFPSSYIKEGEAPEVTLDRLLKEQIGVQRYSLISNYLFNFYEQSRRYPDRMHWDYCFVYDVKLDETPTLKPWYSAVEYVDCKTLKIEDFGSAQGWLGKKLQLI